MDEELDAQVGRAQSRIEELLGGLRLEASAETVERVEELIDEVVGLYGAALARVTEALAVETAGVDEVREKIVDDPLVASLLVAHGLHPRELRGRIERALAKVSPYVSSHGGKVVLVSIEDDVVSLRLEGTCESCASSTATATDLLDRAVREAAPEIGRVEVDTGTKPKTTPAPTGGLVQLGLKKPIPEPTAEASEPSKHPVFEKCEMCGADIGAAHDHVARVDSRELLCVCRACMLLFAHDGAGQGKYRPISDRWLGDESYGLTDLEWARLGIPVRMAFFVMDSKRGEPVGFYPSPGGVVEAAIDSDAWTGIARADAALSKLTPDVEAWLVDGRGREGFDGWVVPLDACYELVARVRMHWAGFDGGDVARTKIDEFFATVREKTSTTPYLSNRGAP